MSRNSTILALVLVLCSSAPALAEIDLSGSWASLNHEDAMERGAGPNPDDWAGLPFNDSGRAKALSFSQSTISMPERICWFQTQWHIAAGLFSLRMWAVPDPVTGKVQAWVVGSWETRAPMTIYMDGRPHPPAYAPHTFAGFSTGEYQGNTLTVTTTHLKRGWIKANGVPQSDAATVVEHFIRHGDTITMLAVIDDPVYLSEPLSKASMLVRMEKDPDAWLYPCDDSEQILGRKNDTVPNHLFGQNPYAREYAGKRQLPVMAALGGVDTVYPQVARLRDDEATIKARMMPSGPPAVSRAPDPTPNVQ